MKNSKYFINNFLLISSVFLMSGWLQGQEQWLGKFLEKEKKSKEIQRRRNLNTEADKNFQHLGKMSGEVAVLNLKNEAAEKGDKLTVPNFEDTAKKIKKMKKIMAQLVADNFITSDETKTYTAIIFKQKKKLYDTYNARQAVDDNNEPIEGIIYITYDDSSFLFGGRKEKEIPDPLYGIPPSVEEIEAFRKGKTVEELKIEEKKLREEAEKKQQEMFERTGRNILIGIMIAGLVKEILDYPGVQQIVQNALQEASQATKMVKDSGARLIVSITTRVKNFIEKLQRPAMVDSKKIIAAETKQINKEVEQGLKGIQTVGRLLEKIKLESRLRLVNSIELVFNKLKEVPGTLPWAFEGAIARAREKGDEGLLAVLQGEENLLMLNITAPINRAIKAGEIMSKNKMTELIGNALAEQRLSDNPRLKEALGKIMEEFFLKRRL